MDPFRVVYVVVLIRFRILWKQKTEIEGHETSPKEEAMLGTRSKGLTGDEHKDLPRSPAWKMTGLLPTEG